MTEEIYKKIWELSPQVQSSESYSQLVKLTKELIELYTLQGRLDIDPFHPTRERKLSLPFEKINHELKNRTCVVTGGLGCVGSALVNELLKFDIKRIIIIDKKEISSYTNSPSDKVMHLVCDIRNFQLVQKIFNEHRPDFVFHTAAQRDPGYAESHICDTVTTNILGTLHIIKACEQAGTVKQCVFSSTGKASKYLTEEIYAGTKKICEHILDAYSKESRIKYAMVRFTHILDNSLMNEELKTASQKDEYLAVHSPGKYVTAQNVKEAAYLMLNALIYSEHNQCNFLLVRYLEWPVESLEVALYYIKQSGRNIPVIFKGNPFGYKEKFFRGQMDWSNPSELNLLINVYEQKFRRYNADEDIIISHICSTDKGLLEKVLSQIETVKGEAETKEYLIEALKKIAKESLKNVDKKDTVNILNWGLQPKFLEMEKATISDYGPIIPFMFESLEGSEYYKEAENLILQK